MSDSRADIGPLLANAAWTRRLARALVQDADAADDIEQEVRVAGWRRPPSEGRPLRAWLARVVRNLAINHVQSNTRRRAREREAVILAETDVPSAEVLALKLEAQQRLVALVDALEPPFRETVLLHYFDGRSSVEIARAKGIPEGTVRWRLKTGLDCIRRALRLEDESKSHDRPASLLLLVECKDGPLRPWSGFAISPSWWPDAGFFGTSRIVIA